MKDDDKDKTFKVALLNCCQREFEADKEQELKELSAGFDDKISAAATVRIEILFGIIWLKYES